MTTDVNDSAALDIVYVSVFNKCLITHRLQICNKIWPKKVIVLSKHVQTQRERDKEINYIKITIIIINSIIQKERKK